MIVVQRGTWPGWPDGVTIELEDDTAAAVLTAARDYQAESHRDLRGDYIALPAGGLRLPDWVTEMQWGFDHRHSTGADKLRADAIYAKYNMDRASNARPVMGTHTRGICADFADNGFLAWLKSPDPKRPGHNIASRYGLKFTLLNANDLRHAQFFPGTNTVALDVTTLDNDNHQEDEMSAHAIVCDKKPGDPHYAWIALVSENGELHIVAPGNRPWWEDYAAGYSPALAAVSVNEQEYITWTTANDTAGVEGQAIDLDALATKTAAKVVASMPSDKPDLTAIEAALAGLPVAIRKELAAHLAA